MLPRFSILLQTISYITCTTWRRQWHPTPVLLPGKSHGGAWKAAVHGVAEGRTRLSDFILTFHFHALEKEMATHSSVIAWRIPGMGEPGGLPSMGSHRVGHDWSNLAAAEHKALRTPDSPNSSSLSPILGFWGTFPRFSSYLKYCSVCLLNHKFFREVSDSPLKAQQRVLEGKLPWNHILTNLDMYLRRPVFSSYFQKDLRSLKVINHCLKYFLI